MELIKHKKGEDKMFPFFESMFDDLWGADRLQKWNVNANIPAVNIVENDGDFEIEMAAPGYKKKDFKIELDGRQITISAENSEEKKDKKMARREFNYSSFSRSFTLPEGFSNEAIKAAYKDGVLSVTIPMDEKSHKDNHREIAVS